MTKKQIGFSFLAVAMFAAVTAGSAAAQSEVLNSRTEFNFNAPVELPGVTLPAGAYVFRFADASTSRQVMQVLSKNDSKSYGLFMTMQARRPEASSEAELRFLETPSGQPVAVKTWWYPQNAIGREFVYPREQAVRLARASNSNVLTTKEDVSNEQMKGAELAYVSPSGETLPYGESAASAGTASSASSSAAADTGASTATSMDRTPQQTGQMAAAQRQVLPGTGSLLPLLAFIGLTSVAGGSLLRLRR